MTRADYSKMSSEEALVAMVNRAVIESTTQAAMEMHRGDPKAIAAASAGVLAQFMDPIWYHGIPATGVRLRQQCVGL